MKRVLNLGLGGWVLLIFVTVIKTKRMLNMQQYTERRMRYALAQGPPGADRTAAHTAKGARLPFRSA